MTLLGGLGLYGYLGALLIGVGAGTFAGIEIQSIATNKARAEKASVQSQYDSYRASVATAISDANAKAAKQAATDAQNLSQAENQLADERAAHAQTSADLQAALKNSAKGDQRSLGPAVLNYLSSVRKQQSASHP